MPSNHQISARTKSGTQLEQICLSFGVTFSKVRDRPLREGQGFSIELPVVLDLLDAIAAGQERAEDIRDLLSQIPDKLYDSAYCYEYETDKDKLAWCVRDGGCRICEKASAAFTRHLKTMAERWRRWSLPDEFPFATGSSMGLHTVTCAVVRRDMPDDFTQHRQDDAEQLRVFAHKGLNNAFLLEWPEQLPGHVPFLAMSAEEARAWMTKNTGPKGGRHYKRCRRCAPTP